MLYAYPVIAKCTDNKQSRVIDVVCVSV